LEANTAFELQGVEAEGEGLLHRVPDEPLANPVASQVPDHEVAGVGDVRPPADEVGLQVVRAGEPAGHGGHAHEALVVEPVVAEVVVGQGHGRVLREALPPRHDLGEGFVQVPVLLGPGGMDVEGLAVRGVSGRPACRQIAPNGAPPALLGTIRGLDSPVLHLGMRTSALSPRLGARSGPRALAVQILAGVLFPVVATGIASIPLLKSPASATNAAMLYLLSVVAAAGAGGLAGGLLASFLSFLGLNFFFTPPLRTFAVAKGEDLLALFAFLIVSVLVATLLTRALAERLRAEQGEEEARLLYGISSRLLGGTPLPTALRQFSSDMVELFSLARCEVAALGLDGGLDLTASAGSPPPPGVPGTVVPLRTERGTFGQVTLYPRPGGTVRGAAAPARRRLRRAARPGGRGGGAGREDPPLAGRGRVEPGSGCPLLVGDARSEDAACRHQSLRDEPP